MLPDIETFGDFFMFLKEVSYVPQSWIYLVKKYSKTVILWNFITI